MPCLGKERRADSFLWHQHYYNEKKALKKLQSVGILLLKKINMGSHRIRNPANGTTSCSK